MSAGMVTTFDVVTITAQSSKSLFYPEIDAVDLFDLTGLV